MTVRCWGSIVCGVSRACLLLTCGVVCYNISSENTCCLRVDSYGHRDWGNTVKPFERRRRPDLRHLCATRKPYHLVGELVIRSTPRIGVSVTLLSFCCIHEQRSISTQKTERLVATMKTTALLAFAVLALSSIHGIRASQVCCPDLRCFSDASPYNGLPLPRCPQYLGIIVKLYTRTNPLDGEEYSRTKFPPSFSADRQLILIVHGWTQSETAEWMHAMKDALLKKGNYNVAIVGWKGGSENFNYVQAAADTRTVGAEIALLAQNAIAQGLQRSNLYCIGHSLGSHVCGYAGQGTTFGRITGLDPASPTFEDRGLGLNTSCADFVDVIHTGGQLLAGLMRIGIKRPIGHVDFYPNGGERQPGCDGKDNKINLLDILMSKTLNDALAKIIGMAGPVCNHLRAVFVFIESIGKSRFVTSELCSSEKNLPLYCGKNGAAVQTMGFNSTFSSARGIFYLTTNDKTPYCQS